MNRRQFACLSTAFLLSQSTLPRFCLAQSQKTVTLNGGFDFRSTKNGWRLDAHDVRIDGLPIPQFSWQWIGLSVAEGILQGIGGGLFVAIANAIFGGQNESMEALMKEQLLAFARILQVALTEDDLRKDQARVATYIRLEKEYSRTPTDDNLTYLRRETAGVLSDLESIGFTGYRTYMTAAGLRLSILQESKKRKLAKQADFEDQRAESVDYHNKTVAYIDAQTNPASIFPPNEACLSNAMVKKQFHEQILGMHVEGFVACDGKGHPASVEESSSIIKQEAEMIKQKQPTPFSINSGGPVGWVNWAAVRDRAKAESTDLGQKMVDRWLKANA
jgi:hypothetical protein